MSRGISPDNSASLISFTVPRVGRDKMIFGRGDQRSRVFWLVGTRAPTRETKKEQEQAFDIHRFMAGKQVVTGGRIKRLDGDAWHRRSSARSASGAMTIIYVHDLFDVK